MLHLYLCGANLSLSTSIIFPFSYFVHLLSFSHKKIQMCMLHRFFYFSARRHTGQSILMWIKFSKRIIIGKCRKWFDSTETFFYWLIFWNLNKYFNIKTFFLKLLSIPFVISNPLIIVKFSTKQQLNLKKVSQWRNNYYPNSLNIHSGRNAEK